MQLSPAVTTDLWQAGDWCDRMRGGDIAPVPIELGPIGVGELLPSWAEQWLVLARERHRLRWLEALEDYAAGCLQYGDTRSALDTALCVIGADPLRESGYYLLVDVFMSQQNRAQAIRCYGDLTDILDRELGVAPTRHLADLLG